MAQTTSALWAELWQKKNTKIEYAFEINGVWYGADQDVEVSHSVEGSLFEDFGIGNAVSATFTLSLHAEDIPRGTTINRFVRLVNGDSVSEWLPKGEFFVNRRAEDEGLWAVEAFDAMRKADVEWVPDQALEFPLSMPAAVVSLAHTLGVEIDPRTTLNEAYTIEYPVNTTTIRDVFRYIAAAHGGNWFVTGAGALLLVPLIPTGTAHDIGLELVDLSDNGLRKPISRVTLWLDDDNFLTAGDDTGMEIKAVCPYATQAMVDALAESLSGFEYQAYSAASVTIDPAAELGDPVTVGEGITSFIAFLSDDGFGYPDISAPGEKELDEEYPSAGPMTKELNRKIAENRALLIKNNEEIRAEVSAIDGRLTKVQQTAGQVSVESTDEKGTLTTLIDSDSWKAWFVDADGVEKSGLHFDFEKGRFVFNGTGQFGGINEGDTYIAIDGQDVCVYDTGGNVVMRLGVKIMPTEAAFQFPYIGMTTRWWSEGSLAKEDTLIIRNPHGMWIGNGHIAFYEPEDSSDYEHLQDFGVWVNDSTAGIFISGWASHVWLVSGKVCTELYTGDTIARFG